MLKTDLVFQVTDWTHIDQIDEDNDEDETASDEVADDIKRFKIKLYGTTKDDKKVYVEVDNFLPYFYVQLPNDYKGDRGVKGFVDGLLFYTKPFSVWHPQIL